MLTIIGTKRIYEMHALTALVRDSMCHMHSLNLVVTQEGASVVGLWDVRRASVLKL
jgi:hypothetical protein